MALDRVQEGSGLILPVLIGDGIDLSEGACPALPHYVSGRPLCDTLVPILNMPTAVRVPANPGPADLARIASAAVSLLRSVECSSLRARAQLKLMGSLLKTQWERIEAVVSEGKEVGAGAYSRVYVGTMPNYTAGEVAVKVLKVSKAHAHNMKSFLTEVEIMMQARRAAAPLTRDRWILRLPWLCYLVPHACP